MRDMHGRLRLPLRILIWTSAALLGLLLALSLFITLFDWNHLRPWFNRQSSALLQRDIRINGDMQLSLARGPATESALTRYLPRLRLTGRDVFIGNTGWSHSGPFLARAAFVDLSFAPLSLLHKHWLITDLKVQQAQITMERSADRRKNWRFSDRKYPLWSFDVQRLEFDRAQIRYVDGVLDADLLADTTPLSNAPGAVSKNDMPEFAVTFDLSGSYRGGAVSGKGEAGQLLDLLNEQALYPVRATGTVGKARASVDGMLTNPHRLISLNLKLTLAGDSLADLYPITDVLLPATGKFETSGQLSATRIDEDGKYWDWHYRTFTGRIGQSDIAGDARYLQRAPRPMLEATIHSERLLLNDLAPSVGAGQQAGKSGKTGANQKDGPAKRGDDKALPGKQFNPEKWGALDADVKFTAKKIERPRSFPLQDISTGIRLQDKVLTLAPLKFAMADGAVTGNLALDGRKPEIQAQLKLAARHLQIRKLFPTLESMQASFGEVNGDAALSGSGNSVARMLATANGDISAVISQGSISKFILEAAGLNVADAIFAKMFDDKQVHLNCAISDFKVEHGRADIRRFMMDTDDAVVEVSGHIDLARELLDLEVHPQTRGVRLLSLRTPLYARGSFSHPDIGAHKGPLIAKAGAAAALALVAPVAAVIPLINMGTSQASDCPAILARAQAGRAAPGNARAVPD